MVIPINTHEIRNRIFRLLSEKGIGQKEFAVLIGTTDKTVSAWKTGRVDSFSSMKWLPKIAEVLDTSVEYLLNGSENAPTGPEASEREKKFMQLFDQLTPEQQDLVLAQLQGIVAAKEKQSAPPE